MSTLALRRSFGGAAAQRRLTELAAALVVAAIAMSSTWFIDSWGVRRGLGMGALVLALVWLATTRRTLAALAVFMVYIGAIDGYAKLSTGSTPVTLVRDALLFAIVAGVLLRAQVTGQRLRLPPLGAWVVAFVLLVFAQMLNPNAGTVVHSLGGVRQHVEFVPLFFLAFAFVRSVRALRWFVVLLLLIASANGAASWVQFNSTPQQFAAWGPGYAERVLAQGRFTDSGRTFATTNDRSRTRPFGLGSDAGAGGIMGALALGGLLVMVTRFGRLRHLLFAAAMALGVVIAIVTSQGRGAVVAAMIVVVSYGVLTATSGRRLASLLGVVVVGLVAFAIVESIVGAEGSASLRYEGLSSSRILQTTTEARGSSLAAIPENIAEYPFGAGLGTAGPASSVAGAPAAAGLADAESWYSFMTLETGVVGMLLLAGFTIALFGLALTRVRLEPDPEARALLAAILAPLAAIIALYAVGGGLTAATPGAPYLWTAGGLVSYWLIVRQGELRRGAA
jgi:hypothetical protein